MLPGAAAVAPEDARGRAVNRHAGALLRRRRGVLELLGAFRRARRPGGRGGGGVSSSSLLLSLVLSPPVGPGHRVAGCERGPVWGHRVVVVARRSVASASRAT